jgi:hypothetical protein
MAWTTPNTVVSNTQQWTAANWNTFVRDNLNETCVAKATTAGRWFVSTGANAIAEREITDHTVATSQTRTSSTYGDLATTGPTVTVTTGEAAMVFFNCDVRHSTTSAASYFSVAVSGATAIAASDDWAGQCDGVTAGNANRAGSFKYFGPNDNPLTAGSNTFTMKYRTTASTATFVDRHMVVFAM